MTRAGRISLATTGVRGFVLILAVLTLCVAVPPAAFAASRIAFSVATLDLEASHIWTVASDGSNPRQLTGEGAFDSSPAWSSDRRSIAFIRCSGIGFNPSQASLMTMASDGSSQQELFYEGPSLVNGMGWGGCLTFSPDGHYLAGAATLGGMQHALVTLDLRTRKSRTVATFQSVGDVWSLSWSPNSRQIVLSAENGMAPSFTLRVSVQTGRVLKKYSPKMGSVSWRPDGKYFLCMWLPSLYGSSQTQIRRLDGSLVRTLGKSQYLPVYSPDGKSYAFAGTSLKRAAGSGGKVRTLYKPSSGWRVGSVAWR
jgi:WD40 repeat protein